MRTRELSTKYTAQENVSFDDQELSASFIILTYDRCQPGMYCQGQILPGLTLPCTRAVTEPKLYSITFCLLLNP
jgi:hypothetical protein